MPLVTTLDGTQTFGMDARALFPKDAPTLTAPPYTEIDFPLYLKPKEDTYEAVFPAIVRSLREPPTPLNAAYFSKANLDAMQIALAQRVRDGMGLAISRQSDWEMLLLMRRVYMEAATNWPDDVSQEVARLNNMVLLLATDAVKHNITKYMAYRVKLDQQAAMLQPADMLTSPPYETGTPAPLVDLNAPPTPRPTASALWSATQPREVLTPAPAN